MIHYDCRFYLGSKPCKHKRLCDGCPHHTPVQERILIIKLGALGDLLRTTPILPSLKKKYPHSQITWITQTSCLPLLENLADIDRIYAVDSNVTARVLAQEFDLVINFDKDAPAAELATIARGKEKKGFGLNSQGSLISLNPGSQYALELGLNDELKFKINQKSYQQIIHEMADLPVEGEVPDYQVVLKPEEIQYGKDWLNLQKAEQGVDSFILAVNPGAGKVFATKKWLMDRYIFLLMKLYREHNVLPLLLGGKDEQELNQKIEDYLKSRKVPVLRPGEDLSLRQFIAIVKAADGMVCGDTLAMHIALAMRIPTVILFLSTCAQEIELYGVGKALVGKAACSPCYLSKCKQPSQYCAESIDVEQVFEAISQHMKLDQRQTTGIKKREKIRRYSNV